MNWVVSRYGVLIGKYAFQHLRVSKASFRRRLRPRAAASGVSSRLLLAIEGKGRGNPAPGLNYDPGDKLPLKVKPMSPFLLGPG